MRTMSEEDNVAKKLPVKRIPYSELLVYQEEFKEDIFRQIRRLFNSLRMSQKDLSIRLGIDEGRLSRRLRGENDMRLDTFSDLARGLGCRAKAVLVPLQELREVMEEDGALYFFNSSRGFAKDARNITSIENSLVKIIDPRESEESKAPERFDPLKSRVRAEASGDVKIYRAS